MATTKTKEGYVKIKLPRPAKGEDEVMYVGANGKDYTIERGVEVEVPEIVANIIKLREAEIDAQYRKYTNEL